MTRSDDEAPAPQDDVSPDGPAPRPVSAAAPAGGGTGAAAEIGPSKAPAAAPAHDPRRQHGPQSTRDSQATQAPPPLQGAQPSEAPRPALSMVEFTALAATMFATIAFSTDAMLPALPEIAAELSPAAPNRAQLIVTSFILGMGIGTFVAGPLSDRFGRKPVILWGLALYAAASIVCAVAPTLEVLLLARLAMGLAAAGPRVVSIALVRDLYAGRGMARIMSFVFLVFTLFPAIAPFLGAQIIALAGWRSVFLAFLLFAAILALWLSLRQPETLKPEDRRPFRLGPILEGTRQILSFPAVVRTVAVQSLVLGVLLSQISSVQQIFDETFGRGAAFPLWFAGIALIGGTASLLNAALVERLGMRFLVTTILVVQVAASVATFTAYAVWGTDWAGGLLLYAAWSAVVFFMAGMTMGNLNAIAMAPLGRLAGLGASVVGAISTVGAAAIAIPVGLAFDGTPRPLIGAVAILAALALAITRTVPASSDT